MLSFQELTDKLEKIEARIQQGEGGFPSQKIMAPMARLSAEEHLRSGQIRPRLGAVLALLYPDKDRFYLCMMKRPEYQGVHSGQISFPGGKKEESDPDLLHTAIREAREEVNIARTDLLLTAPLTQVYIPPSNFLVSPYLALSDHKPEFAADAVEVEAILQLPLEELFEEERIESGNIPTSMGIIKNYPYFNFSIGHVWGATAMITSEIRTLLMR